MFKKVMQIENRIQEQLNNYYYFVDKDSVLARSYIRKLEYKLNPYLLSCIALTYRDEALFKLNGDLRNNFKMRKMILAKKYIDKAFEINPCCIDVLYIKGTIYNLMGDKFTSIDCFLNILDTKNYLDSKVNCSSSNMKYLSMLGNDSYFELYRLYDKFTDKQLSYKFLIEYKKGLAKGINTIFLPIEEYLLY